MIRHIAAAGTALLLTAGQGLAQEPPTVDPMAPTYGNTITIDIPGVYSARQYIEPDHTWRQVGDDGVIIRGVWKVEGDQTCLTDTQPPGPTRCHANVPRKVGEVWTNTDETLGATVRIGLVAGREER